jgi:putative aldouronate transport system substrate-binding protein
VKRRIAVSLSLSLVAGCTASGEESAEDAIGAAGAPFEMSVMFNYDGQPLIIGGEEQQQVEKYTNTKLQIQAVPTSNYKDKINIVLASGEVPKAMMINFQADAIPPTIQNSARSGAFWELGPYLKDYPMLASISPLVYDNIKMDGKIYGIPKVRPMVREGFIYNKDWLDSLGLKEPKTIDDLYQTIKAFALSDPDKNGKNDTYGLIEYKELFNFELIAAYFGAPNNWGVDNGKLIAGHLTAEHMNALKFYKKLYDDKLINLDFAITEREQWYSIWKSGKAGMIKQVTTNAELRQMDLQKLDPKATVDLFTAIAGPKGERLPAERGSAGFYVIPRASVKTEQELHKVLSFFNKMGEELMTTLFKLGIEGKHYVMENGKVKLTGTDRGADRMGQLSIGDLSNSMKREQIPVMEKAENANKENEKFAVMDPTITLSSPTFNEKGTALYKIVQDARIKFIMGVLDEDGWYKEMERWKKEGGDKMTGEFTAEYAKLQKR